jgi:hypothetical protein
VKIDDVPYEVVERAGIYEHDANMNRVDAEMKAIMEYMNKQEKDNAD